MSGRPRFPGTARGFALALAVALAFGGIASRSTPALAQDEPALNCSSCTLRHKDLQKRRNAPGICRIKGAIGEAGERIYQLPGGGRYARTYIDLAKGERWFCSEAEARAAGWKADRE